MDENSRGGYAADIYVRISTTYIPNVDLCLRGIELAVRKLVTLKDNEKTIAGLVTIWDVSNLSSGNKRRLSGLASKESVRGFGAVSFELVFPKLHSKALAGSYQNWRPPKCPG